VNLLDELGVEVTDSSSRRFMEELAGIIEKSTNHKKE